MKRTVFFYSFLILTGALASCDDPSPEEEVDKVCKCMRLANSDTEMDECRKKMRKIADKYAFDPEAAEAIKKRLRECASE